MKRIFTFFLDLLFPRKCIFCRKLLGKEEDLVCTHCADRLPEGTLELRLKDGMRCVSSLRYEGAVRDSIHRFKFGGCSFYSRAYGKIMAQTAANLTPETWDILTWVPLSKKRLRKRGYDQAFLLAKELGKELGCEPVPCLRKKRDTRAQSSILDPKVRRDNVKDVYELINPEVVQGKKILIVDDVVTTGSTLLSCQKVLLNAGAISVTAITATSAAKEK